MTDAVIYESACQGTSGTSAAESRQMKGTQEGGEGDQGLGEGGLCMRQVRIILITAVRFVSWYAAVEGCKMVEVARALELHRYEFNAWLSCPLAEVLGELLPFL